MSSKNDVSRRVLAIQAKKKRKNPKGRGKPGLPGEEARVLGGNNSGSGGQNLAAGAAGGATASGTTPGGSNVALTSR